MDLNDKDDDVRAPDPVIRERLVDEYNFENYNYNYNHLDLESDLESDLDRILKESLEEFELEEEKKVQQMIALERSKIAEKYTNIKRKLLKIRGFDKQDDGVYDTIISIIELYEDNFVDAYELDETSYNRVFGLLKTIRLTKEDQDLLEALIVL